MENILNRIYGAIASDINSMIIEDWNTIYFFSEVNEYLRTFYFYYKDTRGQIKTVDFLLANGLDVSYQNKIGSNIIQYLLELRETFINNKQEPWNLFCFELDSNGEISVHFDYNTLERESFSFYKIRWEYNKLGITRNLYLLSDKEQREILEEKKNKFSHLLTMKFFIRQGKN